MDSTTTAAPCVATDDMTDPVNAIALPIFGILSIFVMYLPFKSFFRSRNFPAGNIIFVAVLQNLMIITNALIWRNGNMSKWYNGAGICDIQVYLRIPSTTAVATSLYAFTRFLSKAIDVEQHSFADTPARRRRAFMIDVAICWTLPIIQMSLFYLILSNRYNILPVYGCVAVTDQSWPSILILIPWAPLCTLLSAIEAVRIIIRLRTHRSNLSKILSSTNSGQSTRRYIKLLLLAVSMIVVVLPVEVVYTMFMIEPQYFPYSFSRIHDPNIWHLTVQLETKYSPRTQYTPWVSITLSFLICFFFGFNNDAVDHYRKWLVVIGFGRIWPTLRETREERATRRTQNSSPGGSGRSSGWRSNLDIVSYIQKHFDGNERKKSQVTTIAETPRMQSRKNSQGTFSSMGLTAIASNTSSQSGAGNSTTFRSFFDEDDIEQDSPARMPEKLPKVIEEPSPTITLPPPTANRGIFNTWRTHLNMPFPLFQRSLSEEAKTTQPEASTSISVSTSQHSETAPPSKHNSRKSSLASHAYPSTTTSTTIWSDPTTVHISEDTNTQSPSVSHVHIANPSTSSNATIEIDDLLDPLSPKLGSRAYRERERREMERDRKEEAEEKSKRELWSVRKMVLTEKEVKDTTCV